MNATTTAGAQGDDVAMVCNLVDGSMIDDDNAPALKSSLLPTTTQMGFLVSGSTQVVVTDLWLEDAV